VELLGRCLESLTRLTHPSYELVVVDNTAGEREVEALATAFRARYRVERQPGLSRARNVGARAARGEIVAYLDDDAVAEPEWLSTHAAALEDPGLAATTGRVLPTSLDAPAAQAYAAAGGEDLGEVPFRVDRTSPQWFEMANFGGIGIGPNMAFRRTLFDSGWGFRESLGPVAGIPGEEHYAFFTLIRDGHAIAYLPGAIVHHDYPETMAALRGRRSRILRGSAAYMAMLLVEEPETRRDTLRYMWQAVRGESREWRPTRAQEAFASRLQLLLAAVSAGPLYVRNLVTSRGGFSPARVPASTAATERRRPSVPS
jgi:glycosyltransferase involved in cell wall biosynthesis